MTSVDHIAAIILAAGYSSRMGEFKPLLKLGSEAAVERSVRLFQDAGVHDVRVVVGHRADELVPFLERLGIAWIRNDQFEQGMFSSVQTGVRSLDRLTEAFFMLPVDIPLVRLSTVRDLIDVFSKSSATVAYPCFLGKRGHPPLISTRLRTAILDWGGDGGLRALLNTVEPRAIDVEVPDECILLGMNTLEHYNALKKRLAGYEIPSLDECKVLLVEKCFVDRRVLVHSCKVAEVAQRLCRQLKGKGYALNEKLILAAALLHDLAKGHPEHATTAARLLRDLGYGPVADLVAAHMDAEGQKGNTIGEIDVLSLADRVVEEDRIVNLEYKFRKRMEEHAVNAQASEAIQRKFADSKRLRQKVEKALGKEIGLAFSTEVELPHDTSADTLLTQTW